MAKRCKIGPKLLLITNRKSHTGFQMTSKPLILDDLEGHYMHFSTENWPYLGNSERYGLGLSSTLFDL